LPVGNARSDETLANAQDLWNAVNATPCMGLASIQLGLPNRMFLAAVPQSLRAIHIVGAKPNKYPDQFPSVLRYGIFINPEIVSTSPNAECAIESCISLPGTFCFVPRHAEIKIRYQTLGTDESHYARLTGLFARVFQHEYDHLDGILITDRHVDPKSAVKRHVDLMAIQNELKELALLEMEEAKGSKSA
jgi:peptide deformylase